MYTLPDPSNAIEVAESSPSPPMNVDASSDERVGFSLDTKTSFLDESVLSKV